jgi:hypothetical protein
MVQEDDDFRQVQTQQDIDELQVISSSGFNHGSDLFVPFHARGLHLSFSSSTINTSGGESEGQLLHDYKNVPQPDLQILIIVLQAAKKNIEVALLAVAITSIESDQPLGRNILGTSELKGAHIEVAWTKIIVDRELLDHFANLKL